MQTDTRNQYFWRFLEGRIVFGGKNCFWRETTGNQLLEGNDTTNVYFTNQEC